MLIFNSIWSQPVHHKPLIIETHAKEDSGNEYLKDLRITADLDLPQYLFIGQPHI